MHAPMYDRTFLKVALILEAVRQRQNCEIRLEDLESGLRRTPKAYESKKMDNVRPMTALLVI